MENDSVILTDYVDDPALEGTIVTFSCPPGMQFTGNNITTATCMGNGEWEPDPRELKLKCKGYFFVRCAVIKKLPCVATGKPS